MPTVKQLNQRHPGCDLDRAADLRALYDGDQLLEKRLTRFLFQRDRETAERYTLRKREWQYRNYVGPIIDYFASMLFTSRPISKAKREGEDVPDPGDYYAYFRDDCDRNGTDIDAFFKARVTDAMVEGRSWLRLRHSGDQPTEPAKLTLKAFEELKVGDSWLSGVDNAEVYDWEVDESGRMLWAIVHSKDSRRDDISGSRDNITETWEHLTAKTVDTYQLTYPRDKPPADSAEVTRVATSPHRYGAVPLLCVDLPPALWVASRLHKAQVAHFRKLNAQAWSLSCTAYAMPVAKVEDPEEFAKMMVGAGYGVVIGKEESWEWEAPPNSHFSALDAEIKAEKDEIFRVAHQMALGVENNAAAVGRSADSKAADIESTRVVLTAFSRIVREAIERTYDLVALARGDQFHWSVEGLDDFAASDLTSLLEQLKVLNDIGGIPSKTFNTQIKQRVAEQILRDSDEQIKADIRQEIEDNEPDPADQPTEQEKLEAMAKGLSGLSGPGGAKPSPFGGPPGASGGAKPPVAVKPKANPFAGR
jgi:hypothetical protein